MKSVFSGIILVISMFFSTLALAADPVIIDVRSDGEFSSGHIQGALHMPYDRIGSLIATTIQDKDTDILLYCRSGNRAGVAKKTLESLGYTSVTNGGGLKDVKKQYPLAE